MGGYVSSDLDFTASPTRFQYEGGTVVFSSTYLDGGFFLDSLYKVGFLDFDVTFPGAAGVGTGNADVLTFGSVTNVGYRFDVGSFVLEPLATFSYARTTFDSFALGGVTFDVEDAESIRGAIGARIGASFLDTAAYRFEGSLLGRVWHEFSDDNQATLANVGLPLTVVDSLQGTYGEVKGGLDMFAKGTGLSAFVNASYKFNDDFDTVTAKGGLRYQW